jgi:hypothetical protein
MTIDELRGLSLLAGVITECWLDELQAAADACGYDEDAVSEAIAEAEAADELTVVAHNGRKAIDWGAASVELVSQ